MKLLRGLAITLLVVVAIWSALWFGASLWIERTFDEQVARLATDGTRIACAGRDVTGYPFALRLSCPEATVAGRGADVAAAGLVAGLSLAAPQTFRAEPRGPARVTLANGDAVELGWTDMDLAVDDLFSDDRVVEGTAADFAAKGAFGSLAVANGTFRAAPTSPTGGAGDDLLVATVQDGILLAPEWSSGLPRLDLPRMSGELLLTGGYEALVRRGEPFRDYARSGFAGEVRRLSVSTDAGGLLLVSGPFSVDREGRPSGTITIGVRNAEAVAAFVGGLFGEEAGLVVTALEGLGQDEVVDGERVKALEVTVADGRIPVGFFSFDLPRLWKPEPSS